MIAIAGGLPGAVEPQDLETSTTQATWRLPSAGLGVELRVANRRLEVGLSRKDPGALSWPCTPAQGALSTFRLKGLIVPSFEGVYVGVRDTELMSWRA